MSKSVVADRIGSKYNRLVITAVSDRRTSDGKVRYLCRCECGNESDVPWWKLRRGKIKSCGCGNQGGPLSQCGPKAQMNERQILHSMRDRCFRKKNTSYHRYGGRGITVCDRWRGPKGFANFYADMGPRPSMDHQIDRIDNDGPYSPENCRWSTRGQQARNRVQNRIIGLCGVSKCIVEWAEDWGVHPSTAARILGVSVEKKLAWNRWVDSLTASPLLS
jgi:hypothetical protein